MNAAQHTPGPWTANFAADKTGDIGIVASDSAGIYGGIVLAEVFSDIRKQNERSKETLPNARLIAAAPELLVALELLLLQCDQHIPKTTAGHRALAQAAIAKATGSTT